MERSEDIIGLVGPYYTDPRVKIHHGDAYTYAWPKGTTWDCVWHDIWANKCTDDLQGHAKLSRSFGKRTVWQGCWGHEYLLYRRGQEKRAGW